MPSITFGGIEHLPPPSETIYRPNTKFRLPGKKMLYLILDLTNEKLQVIFNRTCSEFVINGRRGPGPREARQRM